MSAGDDRGPTHARPPVPARLRSLAHSLTSAARLLTSAAHSLTSAAHFPAWRGLRAKIIAWSFVPTAVILAAVALVAYYAYQQVTQDLVVERNQELARLSAGQLANALADYSAVLEDWAHTADAYVNHPSALQSALAQSANRLAVFDGGVVVLDNRGTAVAAQPLRPDVLGQSWSDRSYFRGFALSRRPAFSGLLADGPAGAPVVAVAVPLAGSRGEFQGCVVGMFRLGATALSSFYGTLVKLRLGGDDLAYLADHDGRLLYHPDIALIGTELREPDVAGPLLTGTTGAVRTRDAAGRRIVASFAPVPGAPWSLVVESDWAALLSAGQGYRRFLLLLLLLGVLVPAGVVAFGTRRITRPIAALVGAAQEVARGNFGLSVTATTHDEIEELVTQFNHMSAELQRSYAALHEREERFSLAMQGANDGLWDWDLESGRVYYSPRWKSMLGYRDDEIEPHVGAWERLIHPDDRERGWQVVHDFIAGSVDKYEIEFRMRHSAGHHVDVLSRAFGVRRAPGGPIVRLVGTHVDITERNQAQRALRESEYKFRGIVEYANIGIAIIQDALYHFVNAYYAGMLGYTPDELLGTGFLAQIAPEHQDRVRDIYERRMRGEEAPTRYEVVSVSRDGERVDLDVSAGAILYQERPAAMIFVRDITRQKENEQEVRRQNAFLAALHETTLGVISRLDTRELLEAVVERAVSLVGAAYGFLYLVTPARDAIEVKVGTGLYHRYVGLKLRRGEGLSGRVWQLGRSLTVDDYSTWSARSRRFDHDPVGPAMGVPLMSGPEIVGVLGVARLAAAAPFRPDEVDLIGRFAQLASVALENARLHMSVQAELADRARAEEALQQRLAFETLITGISTDFINRGPDEIDAGILPALQAIAEFTGSDRSYVFVFSPDGSLLDNTHEWCRPGIEPVRPLYRHRPVDVLPWTVARILRLETVHIPSVAALPPAAAADRECCLAHDPPTRSLLLVPMIYRGRAVGFLGFDAVLAEKSWPADSIALLRITGEILANALEHRRAQAALHAAYETLEQRVHERTRELAAVNDLSAVVSRSLDLRDILSAALDHTLALMGMSLGLAWRLSERPCPPADAPCLELLAERGVSEAFRRAVDPLPLPGSMIEQAAAAGRPLAWTPADYPLAHVREANEREGIRLGLSVPLLAKGRLLGALSLADRQVRAVSPEELSLLAAIGRQVAVAMENARLYEAEQARREEADRRREVAESLREILAALNSTLSLDEILDCIVGQARRLMHSDALALFRLDQDRQALSIQASDGLEPAYAGRLVVPAGRGAVGRAVLTRRPVQFDDVQLALDGATTWPADPDFQSIVDRTAGRFRALLGVPLILVDEVYGALALYYESAHDFSQDEIELAVTFADQAALAIENARLRTQAEEAAAITERTRLARELHDSVTQSLYSVTLYAEAAARLLIAGDSLSAAAHLRELRDTAQEALREMRLLIFQLRPVVLERTGLAAALQARLDAVESRGGLRATLSVDGVEQVSPTVQAELYHIAQEALNNVLKHAQARLVQVELRFGQAETRLAVCDDGAGFDLSAVRDRGGLGLPGMRERVERIGGRLEIDSAPGRGTKLTVQVSSGGMK